MQLWINLVYKEYNKIFLQNFVKSCIIESDFENEYVFMNFGIILESFD